MSGSNVAATLRHLLCQFTSAALAVCAVQAQESSGSWRYCGEVLQPFWLSTTMHGESVLFVQDDPDRPPRATLLFRPTRILAVRSASGEITYQAGKDYVWNPGSSELILTPESTITFQRPQDLRRPANSQRHALTHRDGNGEILFGASHEYHDMQTAVSYQYDPRTWSGPRPSFAQEQLPRTIEKLRNKQPLRITLLGDSISTGCNASGWAKVAPFQPPYQDLLVLRLQAEYGGKITLQNHAVGGTDTAWGLANISKVVDSQPDLVILAFGMNDSARRPAADYQANIRAMLATRFAGSPRHRVHPGGQYAGQPGLDGTESLALPAVP